jgi:hypothetical protein
LDGPDEIGDDSDRAEPQAHDQEADGRDTTARAAPAQPADSDSDHEDRESDADEAQQADGHVPSV